MNYKIRRLYRIFAHLFWAYGVTASTVFFKSSSVTLETPFFILLIYKEMITSGKLVWPASVFIMKQL